MRRVLGKILKILCCFVRSPPKEFLSSENANNKKSSLCLNFDGLLLIITDFPSSYLSSLFSILQTHKKREIYLIQFSTALKKEDIYLTKATILGEIKIFSFLHFSSSLSPALACVIIDIFNFRRI